MSVVTYLSVVFTGGHAVECRPVLFSNLTRGDFAQRQLSMPSLRGRLMSTSICWGVNGHTTRCTSSISVVCVRLRAKESWDHHHLYSEYTWGSGRTLLTFYLQCCLVFNSGSLLYISVLFDCVGQCVRYGKKWLVLWQAKVSVENVYHEYTMEPTVKTYTMTLSPPVVFRNWLPLDATCKLMVCLSSFTYTRYYMLCSIAENLFNPLTPSGATWVQL